MLKIPEKFIKELERLNTYLILRQEAEEIILGTKIIIKESKDFLGNTFQPRHNIPIEKDFGVFFLISTSLKVSGFSKKFLNGNIPILYLDKNDLSLKLEELKNKLDNFVIKSYINIS